MWTLISKNFKLKKLANFPICYNWRIWKINFFYFTIWKTNILPFDKIIKFGYSNNL